MSYISHNSHQKSIYKEKGKKMANSSNGSGGCVLGTNFSTADFDIHDRLYADNKTANHFAH